MPRIPISGDIFPMPALTCFLGVIEFEHPSRTSDIVRRTLESSDVRVDWPLFLELIDKFEDVLRVLILNSLF